MEQIYTHQLSDALALVNERTQIIRTGEMLCRGDAAVKVTERNSQVVRLSLDGDDIKKLVMAELAKKEKKITLKIIEMGVYDTVEVDWSDIKKGPIVSEE